MAQGAPPASRTTADLVLHAKVAGYPMELSARIGGASWDFQGTLTFDGKGAPAPDLAKLLGQLFVQSGLAPLPPAMIPTVTVKEVRAHFGSLAFELDGAFDIGASRHLQMRFAALPATPPARTGPAVVVALKFDSEIPLSIDILRGVIGDISLSQLRVAFASATIEDPPETIAALVADQAPDGGRRALTRGISLGGRLGSPTEGHDVIVAQPPLDAKPDGAAPSDSAPAADPAGAFRKWVSVDKTFGPLAIRRVGGEWNGKEGRLGVLLDASVDLFGLRVGLAGLKVSLPVKDPDPARLAFALDGLDLAFRSGPVEVSGGLLRADVNGQVEYTGAALIKAAAFSISGVGSYALVGERRDPSLFIYALLDKDLGGPPPFHVTGLAAGFGYHRALKIPDIEKVQEFPLVQAAMQPEKFHDVNAMRASIAAFVPPAPGQYWLAAGVRFTSFQMMESFALVALSFGAETVITGLGLSRLTVPAALPGTAKDKGPISPSDPIALVEVALKIVFRPEAGVLTAEARLTANSYVFSRDCKLTGGFAFYLWFKDVKLPGKDTAIPAGDFVVTLGGYHPRFRAPDHYPQVPRLALTWQVSSNLRVAGEVYFALTPTCLMAGGRLSAVYEQGSLRAWFEAYAHFFVAWKPVAYDIEVGIRLGVSYRLSVLGFSHTFAVEVSAAVHFWGPPFAGKAEINWTIISFTVYFGESRLKPTAPPLPWPEFARSFLPRAAPDGAADPLTIAVVSGVIEEVNREAFVNAHQAAVAIKSAVPSTRIAVNGQAVASGPGFGIGPVGITALDASVMEIQVRHQGKPVSMMAEPLAQNVPGALWGGKPFDPHADQKVELIPNALTGVQLKVPPPAALRPTCAVSDLDDRFDRPEPERVTWAFRRALQGQLYDPDLVRGHIAASRTDEAVRRARSAVLGALLGQGLIDGIPRDVEDAYGEMQLQAPPVECGLGMLPMYPADRTEGAVEAAGGRHAGR